MHVRPAPDTMAGGIIGTSLLQAVQSGLVCDRGRPPTGTEDPRSARSWQPLASTSGAAKILNRRIGTGGDETENVGAAAARGRQEEQPIRLLITPAVACRIRREEAKDREQHIRKVALGRRRVVLLAGILLLQVQFAHTDIEAPPYSWCGSELRQQPPRPALLTGLNASPEHSRK